MMPRTISPRSLPISAPKRWNPELWRASVISARTALASLPKPASVIAWAASCISVLSRADMPTQVFIMSAAALSLLIRIWTNILAMAGPAARVPV